MRIKEVYETNDGQQFDSEQKAIRYLQAIYADKLCGMRSRLMDQSANLVKFTQQLDVETEKMRELLKVKDEITAGAERED